MLKTIAVDSGNWAEFPGSEQDKIDIVLERIATRKEGEGIEVEHIDPVSIPELMHQIVERYGHDKIAGVVSNFGGCSCGECEGGDETYYVLAVCDNEQDATSLLEHRASKEGSFLAERLMDENGRLDIGRAIAEKIANDLSKRFGGEVRVREMTTDELMDLDIDIPEGAVVMGAELPKKRTVH